jgi:hypothetical protein
MRVATDTRELAVAPGATAAMVVDVVNTGEVIDGVSARVIGLPDEWVDSQPTLLPLFPDTAGQVRLSLAVPTTLPAGRHALTVEVVSHGAQLPSQYLDVDLDVAPHPGLALVAQPRTVRARRGARFVLELTNEGNIALDVALTASDADRAVRTEFMPPVIRLEAGARAPVLLDIRGPRMITGAELDRTVTVEASARTALLGEPGVDQESEEELVRAATVRLRQRPLLSRGLITVLVLAGIVGLWALAFLLGLTKVFSGDPMTKEAPASFFLAPHTTASGAKGTSGAAAGAAAAAPAGSLPKTGQVPPGTGAAIGGTVVGKNDGSPVGRILVQAWRMTREGTLKPISSAATQSDGTYTLGGLFPTDYYLNFSSPGFTTVWYPNAPSQATARTVSTTAQKTVSPINVVITGLPASISGRIDPGDALRPVTTTVTARPLTGPHNGAATAVTTTAADGSYTLHDLPAPGSYQLTFVTPGYRTSTLTDTVTGGDQRLEPTMTLGAAPGAIGGIVSDGANPIGGAVVSTTLNATTLAVTTPTTGQVGAYVLDNLQTPGTYVVTFSAPGHGSVTKIVDLTAGQRLGTENVTLTSGTGSVSGTLLNSAGKGLGGATVTVGGARTQGGSGGGLPQTTTLTSGAVGSFAISGLPAPGSYTLTFTLAGFQPATVPVTLSGNGAPPNVTVTLSADLGSVTGRIIEVRSDGTVITTAFVGAQITATNGSQTWSVASSAPGGALSKGGYLISGLDPGIYSITVTAPGLQQQTGIVTIRAGQRSSLDLTLTKTG